MSKIAVLGSGGFGTSLAVMAFKYGHEVTLWSKFPEEIEQIRICGENKKLLPGIPVDIGIELTSDIKCVSGKDIVIFAVPSFALRETARSAKGYMSKTCVPVNVAKGFERGTAKRLSQVIEEEIGNSKVVVLSGPSHAEEVARGVPTSIVAASKSGECAEFVQEALMNKTMRIYVNDDIVGVEVGGALKNIIALGAGICRGMQLGDNTIAALMTRGIAEMSRLGTALGGKDVTFAGLSGIGDLIVTCTSMHSRNNRAGMLIGEGIPASQAVERVGTVEGYNAAKTALEIARENGVIMPITEQICRVLYENASPREAIGALMTRPKRNESETLRF